MSPFLCIAISAPTLRAMLDFQSEQDSEFDAANLVDLAVQEWLERQRQLAKPQGQRGYFWKRLFLPEGTRLRISSHSATSYAVIVGDELTASGMAMSPNQFAQMTLGSARNAWNVIQVQMPGDREWKRALRLRHALEADERRAANRAANGQRSQPAAPASAGAPPAAHPAPPLAPAAAARPRRALPEDALLAPQLRPDCEERRKAYRRAEDLLLD